MAAALGGLLLDDGVEDVEKAVQTGSIPGIDLAAAPVDENTKLALKVAVALLGLVGVAVGELALPNAPWVSHITSLLTFGRWSARCNLCQDATCWALIASFTLCKCDPYEDEGLVVTESYEPSHCCLVFAGARAVVKSVKEGTGRLAQRVLDIGKIGAFWIGVFVAVKFVLESSSN